MNRRRWMAKAWLVLATSSIVGGCGPTAYKITPVPAVQTLREKVLIAEGGFAPPKIALIDVEGILVNAQQWSLLGEGEHPVSLLLEKLDRAARDSSVKAVLLRINSPGGTVTASDLMHAEIVRFKKMTGKPVVAVLMDVAASGGYYIACAADEIVAHPTTVTGSIGVIMQTVNVAGTMAKIGIETDAIKSVAKKDAGSPFRRMKPEEKEIFQQIVDAMHDRFVTVVAAGRPQLDETRVREFADGRVYTATQALEYQLVDRIGTLRDVLGSVKEQIGADYVKVVTYQRPLGWKPNLYARDPNPPVNVSLMNIPLPSWWTRPGPRFLYLWQPGA